MKKNTYHLVSLGCAKNTVDSESMGLLLNRKGFAGTSNPEEAEVLIVNTCGFIQASRDEARAVIDELSEIKGQNQLLLATGCYTERYKDQILDEFPKLDGIMGTRNWPDILKLVEQTREKHTRSSSIFTEHAKIVLDSQNIPRIAPQGSSAYLKIADGCRHSCAFCAIPLIKGSTVSRKPEKIIEDALHLQGRGVKELNLIAQDTSDYGADLGNTDGLAKLLTDMLPQIPQIPWVRLLYAYPGKVTNTLIQVMADQKQVLPYLDIPLQHADPMILRKMLRPANLDWTYQTIGKMRRLIPHLALRTTFIVGFPGETEKEFSRLLEFVQEMQFDHMGAFTYSPEIGTPAEPYGDPVPEEVKLERLERIMLLQEGISLENNQQQIGTTLDVLIEGQSEGISVGRSYRDAPEIDGFVFVDQEVPIGDIVPVKITDALVHDLVGKPAE